MSPNGATIAAEIVSVVLVIAILITHGRTIEWADRIAQHLMAEVAALGAVALLSLIRVVTDSSPDEGWFSWLRACVFWLVPAVLAWRLAIIVSLTRRSRKK